VAKRKIASLNRKLKLEVVLDDDKLELTLSKFAQRISDFIRFWTNFFAPQFFDDIQKNFAAEGRYVGGWRALSPAYAAWKLRHYGPKPILVRSGAMKDSLKIGGRGNILRATKKYVIAGSRIKYLIFHQRGTRGLRGIFRRFTGGGLPQRKVIWIGPMRTYSRLLAQFVAEEMRASGFKNAKTA
jgi:hypothetical protein